MKTLMSTIFASLTICWIAAAQDSQVSKSNNVITPDQTTTAHVVVTGDVNAKPETTDIELTAAEAANPAPPVAEKSKTIVVKKLLGPNGEPTFRKDGHYYYMDKDGKPVEINSTVADAKSR